MKQQKDREKGKKKGQICPIVIFFARFTGEKLKWRHNHTKGWLNRKTKQKWKIRESRASLGCNGTQWLGRVTGHQVSSPVPVCQTPHYTSWGTVIAPSAPKRIMILNFWFPSTAPEYLLALDPLTGLLAPADSYSWDPKRCFTAWGASLSTCTIFFLQTV